MIAEELIAQRDEARAALRKLRDLFYDGKIRGINKADQERIDAAVKAALEKS